MATVFVSHSKSEQAFAKEVAKHLTAQGHKIVGDLGPVPPGNYDDSILNMLKNCDIALLLLTKGTVGYDWVASEAGAAKAFRMVRGKPSIVSLVLPDGEVMKAIESFTYQKLPNSSPELAAIEAHGLIYVDLSAKKKSILGVLFKVASEWEPGVKLLAAFLGLITAILGLVAGLYLKLHP